MTDDQKYEPEKQPEAISTPEATAEAAEPPQEAPEEGVLEEPIPTVEEPLYPRQEPEEAVPQPAIEQPGPSEPVYVQPPYPAYQAYPQPYAGDFQQEYPQQQAQPYPPQVPQAPQFSQAWQAPQTPYYQPAQPPQPPQGYQQGYYYPPQPGYGQYPYQPPVMMPKKKMSTGLKVFIWIASVLAGLAILGFGAFLVYSAVTNTAFNRPGISDNDFFPDLPDNQNPFTVPGDPDEDDKDGSSKAPDDNSILPPGNEQEEFQQPDVDVTPNTEGITIQKEPGGEELSAQEVYNKVVKSTVTVAATRSVNGQEAHSTGSGIIATSDGYIITNSHVVWNSKSVYVKITTYDGEEHDAVVVGMDRTTDLAVLKINDQDFSPAEFGDAEELVIGDLVVAIGNPGGAKFSGSMTGGYISGLNREVGQYSESGMTFIQTDAAINPGNSGGPLVNMYGQVVGINSSKIITDGYEGMGFAIPVSKAKDIIDQLLSGGYVKGRVRLGITGSDVTAALSAIHSVPQGFQIVEIGEDSSLNNTDAQAGDIIVALDGETVTCLEDISNLLLRYAPGDEITLTLYRPKQSLLNGEELEVTITLLEDKGETQK